LVKISGIWAIQLRQKAVISRYMTVLSLFSVVAAVNTLTPTGRKNSAADAEPEQA
jgi:hypothetical protein